MADDPERLVTDALRAQATSTNAGFAVSVPIAEERPGPLSVWWVLGLALLLGLAAGTVAAVITLS
ncbi:hypothetical protein G7043_24240 [Lentzea sp. NEAU-D13]|uniref:Uncharacterized protein n=1 Tax=Lentzea alba TaxID=2714351 RepID=A0A7C9RS09_9PSEU|nr:hypothetical protein [Lentzea alba]NGY62045.1 hypothetical protein [Lentzea alba]